MRNVLRRERTVGAGEAEHEIADRIGHRLQITVGDAVRDGRAEGIAIARGVFDGDEALPARDRRPRECGAACAARASTAPASMSDRAASSSCGEIAEAQQQIVNGVDALGLVALVEVLQLQLGLRQRFGVEQLAQLRLAEELAELRLIDGQRLRPPFGERRIAVVEKVGDVTEQDRRGERRRLAACRPCARG